MTVQRILVVDDDPGIRRTLQIGLSKAGYRVFEARDGEEAIRLWQDLKADLVIADIYMPKKSGVEVIKELHADSPATPIIAMTDGGRSRNFNPMSYSELLGAVRTISKPFTLEAMLTLVKEESARCSSGQITAPKRRS